VKKPTKKEFTRRADLIFKKYMGPKLTKKEIEELAKLDEKTDKWFSETYKPIKGPPIPAHIKAKLRAKRASK
jgi:hypothetical protein